MTIDISVAVAATAFILLAYGFLNAQTKVVDLTIRLEKTGAMVANDRRAQAFRLSLIVERLDLENSILPNPTVAIYSLLCDLYDTAEMLPYKMPIEAIDENNIRWLKNIKDFDEFEIFSLWLGRVID